MQITIGRLEEKQINYRLMITADGSNRKKNPS